MRRGGSLRCRAGAGTFSPGVTEILQTQCMWAEYPLGNSGEEKLPWLSWSVSPQAARREQRSQSPGNPRFGRGTVPEPPERPSPHLQGALCREHPQEAPDLTGVKLPPQPGPGPIPCRAAPAPGRDPRPRLDPAQRCHLEATWCRGATPAPARGGGTGR